VSERVFVGGVGMIPFAKPGKSDTYQQMGSAAAKLAIEDAGIDYAEIGRAFVGYVYADSTAGQAALYPIGLTGIPIFNVNNNCASGSSALFLAREAVASGQADIVLALGFEQMEPGALGATFSDRPSPLMRTWETVFEIQGFDKDSPPTAQLFSGAANDYDARYGLEDMTLAKIAEKSRRHAGKNPFAIFRDPMTAEEVLASPTVHGRLTRLQCCPPTSGAAATVLMSERAMRRAGITNAVEIAGQAIVTDMPSTFDERSMMKIVGYDLTKEAARQVYEQAGVGPEDVDVVELHDCFTVNELISYEALGLVGEGDASRAIAKGDNTYGGAFVANPSGGLLSKGHPLGATGLAQCAELVWQLQGRAGERQVPQARIGLQHNIGIGGACVVTAFVGAA
tara:strand:+ start:3141 stop:4328 length:1188 start_codon:yes stop_codon:yes gene_type:complete